MPDLFTYSIAFVLSNETFTRHGEVISMYEDAVTGECSNWGISLAWFRSIKPDATAADIKSLTKEGATHLYEAYFWDMKHLEAIALPKVAAKVLDAEVNMGASQGVRLLQQALGLFADGVLGPVSTAACNAADEDVLYKAFVRCAAVRYQRIHDAQVKEFGQVVADKNLSEWLARLSKIPPVYAPIDGVAV